VCCSVLQCVAVCCRELQCGAVCCCVVNKWPFLCMSSYQGVTRVTQEGMRWLQLVASLKLQVSFAKEPYKRDDILQKRPIIVRSLRIVATPYHTKGYHVTHEKEMRHAYEGAM